MGEFLSTINHGDYSSDYWLFEDDYIKEVRREKSNINTYLTEITDFIKKNSDDNIHQQIIDRIKEYKDI